MDCQVTAEPPMNELNRRVHEMESRNGILSVTVATGFPWADVPDMSTRGGPAYFKLGAQHKKFSGYIESENDVVPVRTSTLSFLCLRHPASPKLGHPMGQGYKS